MTLIAPPSTMSIRHVEWSLDRPAQVNRSAYTGARKVAANPWHGKWSAKAELVPIIGETNVRAIRAFFASLRGQINTFKLRASEGPQYTPASITRVISNGANVTVTDLTGGLYSLAKSGGVNGTYDADARSTVAFNGDCYVRVRATTTGNTFAVGLNADPATDSNYSSIDRAVHFLSGRARAYESGQQASTGQVYGTSEYYFVQRIGTAVYLKTGSTTDPNAATVLWQFTDLDGPLFFDSSLAASAATCEVMFAGDAQVTTNASGAQGASSLSIAAESGLLRGTILPGMLGTIVLPSGKNQLVMIASIVNSTDITINFEPALREAVSSGNLIHMKRPFGEMALAGSASGWSVDPGTLYALGFDAEEAF